MVGNNDKYAYYATFPTNILLAAKELLKSMPAFYNNIYFSTKYANALWNGESDDIFANVTILTEVDKIDKLRNIIKSNFLYINDWDSLRNTNGEDYGFSFIAGHVKYILLTFRETPEGYVVRSYDADRGDCYETTISVDKKYFLDVSMKENGEFVRICDFNLEYINNNNSKKFRAQKKAEPEMIIYKKEGYAITNMYLLFLLAVICLLVVWVAYCYIKFRVLG